MGKVYRLGLDLGSTTIKVVLLDGEKIIHSDYQRHHSDVSGLLNDQARILEWVAISFSNA